jgi:hypothetical protein
MPTTPYLATHSGAQVDDGVDKARWSFPLWSITGLTGGGAGNLDGVDVTGIVTGTTVKVVIAGVLSIYQLQETTDQESSPDLIIPDTDPESVTRGWVLIPAPGAGTVTSVALSVPAGFSVAGSPIVGAGGFAVTENTQAANLVKAGPATGADAIPTYRALTMADLPAGILGALRFQTVWNATTNSPALASGVGTAGYFYKVSVAGTTTIDGVSEWNVGDWIVFDGTVWNKIDNTEEDATLTLKGRIKLAGVLKGTADLPELVDNAVATAAIAASAVTLAKLANMATASVLGNNTGGAAAPIALTAAQVRTLLGLVIGTSGRLARFTATPDLADSAIRDDGTTVGIGVAPSANYGLLLAKALGVANAPSTTIPTVDVGTTTSLANAKILQVFYNAATAVFTIVQDGSSNILASFPLGNLGLGIAVAAARLHSSSAGATGIIELLRFGYANAVSSGAKITFYAGDTASETARIEHFLDSGTASSLKFYTFLASALSKRLEIDAAGAVNVTSLITAITATFTGKCSAKNFVASAATKTPSATPVWDFDAEEEETMSLTAAITGQTTSNRGDGKKKTIWIVSDGTLRTLAVNASWIPIGPAIDANLAANKTAILALHCKGSGEANVYYSYKAQP